MLSVRGCDHSYQERFSVATLDFSSSPKSEFSKQPAKLLRSKFPAAAIDISKYSKDDL